MAKRKVLIPLDGSEFSRQIVRVVRTFFEPRDVSLVLFRAAYPPSVATDVAPQDVFVGNLPMSGSYDAYSRTLDAEFSEATKERETYRSQLVDELRGEADRLQKEGYTVGTEVHFGDPAQRIIDYVNDEGVELVAMATHGRSGIGRLVLGSVAERVLRGVSVPVLLMRSVQDGGVRAAPAELLAQSLGSARQLQITIATDGSTLAQQALTVGVDLAQALNAQLTVLVAVSDRDLASHSQQLMEQVAVSVGALQPRPAVVPVVGYAEETLLNYVSSHPTDILLIGPFRDRGAGSTTAIGSTAQGLAQHAPTSVWVHKGRRAALRRILACVAADDTVVVDVAAQLARATGAELNVLHVASPAAYPSALPTEGMVNAPVSVADALAQGTHLSTLLQGWIGQLEREGSSQEALLLERGSAPEAILKTAHEGGYDLLVVGSQSGPGQFLGSVANSVVRYAEQSVLVVRTRTL